MHDVETQRIRLFGCWRCGAELVISPEHPSALARCACGATHKTTSNWAHGAPVIRERGDPWTFGAPRTRWGVLKLEEGDETPTQGEDFEYGSFLYQWDRSSRCWVNRSSATCDRVIVLLTNGLYAQARFGASDSSEYWQFRRRSMAAVAAVEAREAREAREVAKQKEADRQWTKLVDFADHYASERLAFDFEYCTPIVKPPRLYTTFGNCGRPQIADWKCNPRQKERACASVNWSALEARVHAQFAERQSLKKTTVDLAGGFTGETADEFTPGFFDRRRHFQNVVFDRDYLAQRGHGFKSGGFFFQYVGNDSWKCEDRSGGLVFIRGRNGRGNRAIWYPAGDKVLAR